MKRQGRNNFGFEQLEGRRLLAADFAAQSFAEVDAVVTEQCQIASADYPAEQVAEADFSNGPDAGLTTETGNDESAQTETEPGSDDGNTVAEVDIATEIDLTNEAPVEATSSDEAPIDEAPIDEAPIEEAIGDETSNEEVTVPETVGDEFTGDEVVVDDVVADDVITDDIVAEDVGAHDNITEVATEVQPESETGEVENTRDPRRQMDLTDGMDGYFGSIDAENPTETIDFTVAEDGRVEIVIATSFGDANSVVDVTDADGNTVATSNEGLQGFDVLAFDADQGQSYQLSISSDDAATGGRFQVTVGFEKHVDQHANEIGSDSTQLIIDGGTAELSGRLETSGDIDTFRFTAATDGEVVLQLNEMVDDARVDLDIRVMDASGNVIADGATNRMLQIEFDVQADCEYFVSLNAADGQKGEYRFNLEVAPTPSSTEAVDVESPQSPAVETPLVVDETDATVVDETETANPEDVDPVPADDDEIVSVIVDETLVDCEPVETVDEVAELEPVAEAGEEVGVDEAVVANEAVVGEEVVEESTGETVDESETVVVDAPDDVTAEEVVYVSVPDCEDAAAVEETETGETEAGETETGETDVAETDNETIVDAGDETAGDETGDDAVGEEAVGDETAGEVVDETEVEIVEDAIQLELENGCYIANGEIEPDAGDEFSIIATEDGSISLDLNVISEGFESELQISVFSGEDLLVTGATNDDVSIRFDTTQGSDYRIVIETVNDRLASYNFAAAYVNAGAVEPGTPGSSDLVDIPVLDVPDVAFAEELVQDNAEIVDALAPTETDVAIDDGQTELSALDDFFAELAEATADHHHHHHHHGFHFLPWLHGFFGGGHHA